MAKKKTDDDLPVVEEIDFSYLLALMRPIYHVDGYALLPELFSILGHKKIIELCRYFGGETFTVPTLEELADSIDAIQWFYDVFIKHDYDMFDVPIELKSKVLEIKRVYDARKGEERST